MLSLLEARTRVLSEAEPSEGIETALSEAMGLILAELLYADVDLPPFDRAAVDGYAVRASDALAGTQLRVIGPGRGEGLLSAGQAVDSGECTLVAAGDPMPVGADAVVRVEDSRPEPGFGGGPPRELTVLKGTEAGRNVVPRGFYQRVGDRLASSGSRVTPAMVGLLAAQGCVHPICHRRARVSVIAVGEHLVGPGEAPVMHRERNAAGLTAVIPCLHWGATSHDLGAVPERDLPAALDRALNAPVVIVLGAPDGAIPRALSRAKVEPVFSGVSLHPGKRSSYGVVRGVSGRADHHVFHFAPSPVGVLTAMTLLVGPLIARLHGAAAEPPRSLRAVWSGPTHRPTDDRSWAVPVTLDLDPSARIVALPIDHRGKDDLPGFAHAGALAILPPRSGPWQAGEIVEVVPLAPWPAGTPG
jgi:molybdopterin molybdotransferase